MLTVGSIRSFCRLKKNTSFTPKLWQSPAPTTTSCQGATSANLPLPEHLQSSQPWPGARCHQEILQVMERYININDQTPPRDAQNTMMTLHPHSFSRVVWARCSPTRRRHGVEKATPRGWDCPVGLVQSGLAVPCWKQEMVGSMSSSGAQKDAIYVTSECCATGQS